VTYTPTAEQAAVIAACKTGAGLVVEAAAGAGKTSTLRMAASEMRGRVLYLAYNKAAQVEARASFPPHVKCSTVHALAFGAVGRQYAERLRAPRQSARETARRLGLRDEVPVGSSMVITPLHLARFALGAVDRFCQSADLDLDDRHVPQVPGMPTPRELLALHAQDRQAWAEERRARADLVAAVLPVARQAWADIQDPRGTKIRYQHDHYLKQWQLTSPELPYDVVMLDEAQDSNPVTASVVTAQQCQRIAIGDSMQQLYEWRGARDALASWPAEHRLYLTQSWRFGQVVADEANKWLSILGTDLRVRGNPALPSTIGPVPLPDAVLCRSNAGAISRVMAALEAGQRPALVGGTGELVKLAEAAEELKSGRRTSHPELFPFISWGQVQEYSAEDGGSDLRVFVKLVDEHGPDVLITALSRAVDEARSDVVVSTAHKSKGREWARVAIQDDFTEPKKDDNGNPGKVQRADAMLAYVAVTRAKLALDRGGLAWVDRYVPELAVV
jgi:hypothetical protein